jgi:DNA-directed RNA polymerase subunit beta'
MAIELYLPFLIRYLLWLKKVPTIVEAKMVLEKQMVLQNSGIWKILAKIMANHPVLLNRAPTLHRLGIQAFQPLLVEGKAILLHPLVCPAFNADFDGDQMAVHVPLSSQARAEAWNLLWSRNNILSTATGQPLLAPAQDMILGSYFLSTRDWKPQKGVGKWFSNLDEVLLAYNQKNLSLHSPVWVRCNQSIENGGQTKGPLELYIHTKGRLIELHQNHQRHYNFLGFQTVQFVRTTPGRVLMNQSIKRSILVSKN